MEPAPTPPTVTIPATHLAALEAEIASLKARLAKRTHHNISSLREYDATHPEKNAERVRRHREKNRDAYNARRREQRRLKKAAVGGETDASITPPENPGTE